MSINLGAAFVDIVPSTSNLAKELRGQVDQPLAQAGESAGQSFMSRFAGVVGSAISGTVRVISDTIIGGISAAATVAGGLFVSSLFSGWQRFTTIEDSTRALTILLGDATKAAELLDQVLGVVRGTPFNLDQFAAAAQRMVGMGIEAEKIPGYLTAIGEAASTQGKNADEFADRLSRIFGQVAAAGQIQLVDVWRISDTGVPALQILANEFGVTTDAMKDMISKGAVPAERALDALADGIVNGSDGVAGATVAFGGTMAGLRTTLSGAAGGFRAALARFGAGVIAPLAPALTAGFTALAAILDDLGPRIGDALTGLVNSPGFTRFTTWVSDIPNNLDGLTGAFTGLSDALGPLVGIFAGLAASNLAGPLRLLGLAIPGRAIMVAVGAFVGLLAVSPQLRDALVGLGEALLPIVEMIGGGLAAALEFVTPLIADGLTKVVEGLTGAIETLTPHVETLVGWLGNVGSGVKTAWEDDGLKGAFGVLGAQIDEAWDSTIYPALVGLGNRFAGWTSGLWSNHLQPGLSAAWDSFAEWLANDGAQKLLDQGLVQGDALVGWITAIGIPLATEKINEFVDFIADWLARPENIEKMTVVGAKLAVGIVIGLATIQQRLRIWALELLWALIQAVSSIAESVSNLFHRLGIAILTAVATGIRDAAPQIREALVDALKSAPSFIPGFGVAKKAWDFLPGFDDGGVVPGPVGQPRVAVVHGGETILPTHKASFQAPSSTGDGLTVSVDARGINDPYQVAEYTSRIIANQLDLGAA